ncbi:hypothetical protein FO520_23555, partial [Bacillus subtilis]
FKSLEQVHQDSPLFILCMDEDTHRVLHKLNMKQLNLVTVAALANELLLKLKETRDHSEYYGTMKTNFLQAVLTSNPELERVT